MDINNIIANKVDNISQPRVSNVKPQTEFVSSGVGRPLRDDINLTKENIKDIVDTLNSAAKSVNQRVSFSFSEKTNRVILKFINSDTEEVLREIPPKEMIRLLERMHELIGMFVDESR